MVTGKVDVREYAAKLPDEPATDDDEAELLEESGEFEENLEELAMLEVLDNGKPLAEASNLDLPLSIQCYRYYAGWADKLHGSVISPSGPVAKGNFGYLEKEPVGNLILY